MGRHLSSLTWVRDKVIRQGRNEAPLYDQVTLKVHDNRNGLSNWRKNQYLIGIRGTTTQPPTAPLIWILNCPKDTKEINSDFSYALKSRLTHTQFLFSIFFTGLTTLISKYLNVFFQFLILRLQTFLINSWYEDSETPALGLAMKICRKWTY